MKLFCSTIYNHHIEHHHSADYEVCRGFWCRVAYWIEKTFGVFARTA